MAGKVSDPADHLRYAGLPFERQRGILFDIVRGEPLVMDALEAARRFDLPQWRIVSGVIYNTVWNVLTARPPGHGIRDIDLFYFDGDDMSWEAEDRIIASGRLAFEASPLPVEIRNQARVHLWFPEKFGQSYEPLETTDESIGRFAAITHAIGLRLEKDGSLDLCAPFGLDSVFSFHVRPNRVLDNCPGYTRKGERAKMAWPELTVDPW
jgi:hypothetical protein